MARSWALAAAFVGACGPAVPEMGLDPSFPDEIAHAALLLLDSNGGLVGSSGLMRVQAGHMTVPVRVEADPDRMEVHGYSSHQVAAFGDFLADDLAGSAVSLARSGEPSFGVPEYSVGGAAGGEAVTLLPTEPRLLTAAWVPPCPPILARYQELRPSTNCSPRCQMELRATSACEFDLQASSCRIGDVRGVIDASGRAVRMTSSGSLQCQGAPPAVGAALSFECTQGGGARCWVDLHAEPFHVPVTADILQVAQVEPRIGNHIDPPILGWLGGFAQTRDLIAVAGFTNFVAGPRCDPSEAGPSRIWFVDPGSLEVTRTATAPPCLTQLAPDPIGDGFVAIFRPSSTTHAVGRFDESGRLVEATEAPGGGPDVTTMDPNDLVAGGDPPYAAVIFASSEVNRALLVDLGGAAPRWLPDLCPTGCESIGDHPSGISILGDGRLAIVDRKEDRIHLIDPESGLASLPVDLSFECGAVHTLSVDVAEDPRTGALVIGADDEGSEIYVVRGEQAGESCRSSALFSANAEVKSIVAWPAAGEGAWLAGLLDADGVGRVGIVDSLRPAFFPGTLELGDGSGPVSRLFTRGDEVFGLLPYSGKLVRIRLR
ncbi:MAG: hypothetical protein HYV07_06130 [Deltaproteobacteria bacterium]|nr:hypothetical protein [Deltaproteobacteria bacterium]